MVCYYGFLNVVNLKFLFPLFLLIFRYFLEIYSSRPLIQFPLELASNHFVRDIDEKNGKSNFECFFWQFF